MLKMKYKIYNGKGQGSPSQIVFHVASWTEKINILALTEK